MEFKEFDKKERIIILQDEITESNITNAQWKITSVNEDDKDYIEKVKTITSPYGDLSKFKFEPPHIKLYLSTFGGSAYDGFGLHDIIKKSETPIDVYCVGKIMSVGVFIMLGAKNRYAYENTTFMIHQVSGWAIGETERIKENLEECERLCDKYFSIITENTNITREKLEEIKTMKKDWYINAFEALELGLITKIL